MHQAVSNFRPLSPGDPIPWFHAASLSGSPRYAFSSVAGRWVVLLLCGSAGLPEGRIALERLAARRAIFDDQRACFFGITVDAADAATGRIAQSLPGIRWFLDYDRKVSILLGAAQEGDGAYTPQWMLLDPLLRLTARFPIDQGDAAFESLNLALAEPPLDAPAPVLVIPRIFEPALCRTLIDLHRANGGEESGFMREVNGKTVLVSDPLHKVRRDCAIEDEQLRGTIQHRVRQRLAPLVQRAFQFEATRMERYIVACYDAESGGHFKPHRDNTTKGTAHRRFAVTINLNADEYDGGDLRFPEFGPRTYRAPTGGAVVFSCSLLHEATPVTRGSRYAFLPFLYDAAAAQLRERNNVHLGDGIGAYKNTR